jgi:cytidine deaminase
MVNISKNEKELLEASSKALQNAYVLWGFKVGVAVLGEDGKIYEGCNVESWISGLGICAERCAINHAVLHGNKKILEIAVVTEKDAHEEPKPCGMCLQYINDFALDPGLRIVMANVDRGKILSESVRVNTLRELLPFPFEK